MRVGIIGAGNIARLHLRALRKMPGTHVTGILDTQPGAAAKLAKQNGGAAAFDSAEKFYAEAKPEIVHVLTPPATHHAVTIEALRRGHHVLVEKPMAMTPEQCLSMSQEARKTGVTLGVDHNLLFDPRVLQALRLVRAGAVGDRVHIETTFGFDVRRVPHFSGEESGRKHWAYSLPGGLLEDLLPHPLYVTLAFLGEEARLTGSNIQTSGRAGKGLPDELRLSISGAGVTGQITESLSIQPDLFTVMVYGNKGSLRLDIQNMLLQKLHLRGGPKALAKGIAVAEASIHSLARTAINAAAILSGHGVEPGDPAPLIKAHHTALNEHRDIPVGVDQGVRVVEKIREVWPV